MEKKVLKFDEYSKIDSLNEYKENKIYGEPLTDVEKYEMSSFGIKTTGIENIVFWFGPNENYNEIIVKISNIAKDPSGKDCFTILLNNMGVIGGINKELITDEVMKNIKKSIKANMKLILSYYNDDLASNEFYDDYIRIKDIK